jgi:hypothetical protein
MSELDPLWVSSELGEKTIEFQMDPDYLLFR